MEVENITSAPAKNTSLISVEELVSELFEAPAKETDHSEYELKSAIKPNFKVIDASMGGNAAKEAFFEKSIPTAVFLDVMQEFKDKTGRFPNTFPTEEIVKQVLQNLGIDRTDQIVLYAQPGKTVGATRAFVILKSYGFENVRVLDGGFRKYTEEGYPTAPGKHFDGRETVLTDLSTPDRHTIQVTEVVKFALGQNSDLQVIDTRPASSFNGEASDNVSGCRQGNVPGSINIPAGEFLNSDETFKKGEDLQEVIDKYSLDPTKNIVSMCRTGMMATIAIVALLNNNKFENIRLYDGSWSEYGSL